MIGCDNCYHNLLWLQEVITKYDDNSDNSIFVFRTSCDKTRYHV